MKPVQHFKWSPLRQWVWKASAPFLFLFLSSCGGDDTSTVKAMSFQEFTTIYNNYIEDWLKEETLKVETKLAETPEDAQLQRDLEKLSFRKSLGGYFMTKTEEELPEGLVWEDGMDEPEIGDPRAQKGGVLRRDWQSFPSTLRSFGSEANSFWRDVLYDKVHLDLISLHPETGAIIPAVADKWAVTNDGKTVIFHIDQDATYSDGVKVSADDVSHEVFYRISDYVHDAYSKQYFREQFSQFCTYGEKYISISLPSSKPLLPYHCNMPPAPKHFYEEYGPDFEERYQWKFIPTTGAYEVKPSGLVKGVSVTQSRVKDWWAKDKKFYRHRFNPDAIKTTIIRDKTKAFELFRAGELDYFGVTSPEYWYEKTEIPEVFNGYIEKSEFYNIYPRRPLGMYLNTHTPKLSDLDFRIGLHHAINWQKVINSIYRGDFSRLNQYSEGWGRYTNSSIKARPFSVEKARKHFSAAGYKKEDKEGYLINDKGERASVQITFGNYPEYHKIMNILKTEAKAVGVELILDALESGVWRKKLDEKSYEICIVIFGVEPPFPRYFQMVHSSNAYDAEGNPKKSTNNLFSISDERLDKFSENMRYAKNEMEVEVNAKKAQQVMHDLALFIPGHKTDFSRVASWRWLRWPQSKTTQFLPAQTNQPYEVSVYWIDAEMQKETLEAKRKGDTFPESVTIYDQYRKKGGSQ